MLCYNPLSIEHPFIPREHPFTGVETTEPKNRKQKKDGSRKNTKKLKDQIF